MIVKLENEDLSVVLSSLGGTIESIVNKKTGNEHYWKYDSAVWPRRTNICFPVCGALTNGAYTYEGKQYTLPMHGFLREHDLVLAEQTPVKAVFTLCSDNATREIYPFDFLFTLTQELDGGSLNIRYTVENTGDKDLYYSVGSHYTYKVPIVSGESWEDYEFLFAKSQNAGKIIVENLQVAGKTGDIFYGADRIKLEGLFENGSVVLELADIKPHEVSISGIRSSAYTKVQFDGFDYCVLWAPKDKSPFACIEPWGGILDQKGHDGNLANKLGIKKLNKGGQHHYNQIITVK